MKHLSDCAKRPRKRFARVPAGRYPLSGLLEKSWLEIRSNGNLQIASNIKKWPKKGDRTTKSWCQLRVHRFRHLYELNKTIEQIDSIRTCRSSHIRKTGSLGRFQVLHNGRSARFVCSRTAIVAICNRFAAGAIAVKERREAGKSLNKRAL